MTAIRIPQVVALPTFSSSSGTLTAFSQALPTVEIRNIFWIDAVRHGESRGGHAHWETTQFLIAVHGSFDCRIDSQCHRDWSFHLSSPQHCLVIPPRHWIDLTGASPLSSLLVLADRSYCEDDYIRSRVAFDLNSGA